MSRSPWTIGAIAAGIALALVGAFVGGRFSAPEVVATRDVERVVYRDRIVDRIVEVAKKAETKIIYRDRVITKDRIVEREVERADVATDTNTNTNTVTTREGETVREVTKTVTLRPQWRVGILAGAAIRDPLVTLAGPLVLGIEVDRRIVGGLSAGVWINTYGAAGIALSLEF